MRQISSCLPRHPFHGGRKKESTISTADHAPAVSITSDTYCSDVSFSPIRELRSLFVGSQTKTVHPGQRKQNFRSPGTDAEHTSPEVGCMGQVKCPSVFHRAAAKPSKPSADHGRKCCHLLNLKMIFSGMWKRKRSAEDGNTNRKKYRRKATAEEFGSTEGSPAASVTTDQPAPSFRASGVGK